MIKITTPHADGIKFKCYQCKKLYVVKNGKHQEITDRLEIEDLSGNLGEEQTLCKDCWKKRHDKGFNEPTSLHR